MDGERRVVALDIGGTKIASALVTIGGGGDPAVEHLSQAPTDAGRGGRHVLATALVQARRVLGLAGVDVAGIGVSSAGVIDPTTGDVTYANDLMPGWGGIRLGAELERELGVSARVLNDVHAHALGEARWGAGRGAASCLVMAVGTGIGGAYVDATGHIMLGAHNEAGHIGHVSCTDAAGVPCSCGATGHLEPIAAGPGIIARYLELGGDGTTSCGAPIDGAEIDRRAATGDEAAIWAESRSGHAIGEVLGSLCNLLDPAVVILSGSVAQCGAAWHDALARGWSESVMPPVAATPVVSGSLGGRAPLIGAAEHVLRPAYAGVASERVRRGDACGDGACSI